MCSKFFRCGRSRDIVTLPLVHDAHKATDRLVCVVFQDRNTSYHALSGTIGGDFSAQLRRSAQGYFVEAIMET